MTAAAFAPSSPSVSVTEAMFQAEQKASTMVAVYVAGCGTLLAISLLSLAYGVQMGAMLHGPAVLALVLTTLWIAVGAVLMHKQYAHTRACTARYEAVMQQKLQARLAQYCAAPHVGDVHAAEAPRAPRPACVQNLINHCMPARLPVSLFGAHMAYSYE